MWIGGLENSGRILHGYTVIFLLDYTLMRPFSNHCVYPVTKPVTLITVVDNLELQTAIPFSK